MGHELQENKNIEYLETLSVYLALKAHPSFAGLESKIVESFDAEVAKFVFSGEKYDKGYSFIGTWSSGQEELEKKIQAAQNVIADELEHMKELKKKHKDNWKNVHYSEMKGYLAKLKQINQHYT